jgi:hypothetical protein
VQAGAQYRRCASRALGAVSGVSWCL